MRKFDVVHSTEIITVSWIKSTLSWWNPLWAMLGSSSILIPMPQEREIKELEFRISKILQNLSSQIMKMWLYLTKNNFLCQSFPLLVTLWKLFCFHHAIESFLHINWNVNSICDIIHFGWSFNNIFHNQGAICMKIKFAMIEQR